MTQSIPIRRLCQCIIMAGLFIFVGIIVPNSFVAEAQNESTVTPSQGASSPAPTTEPPPSSASPTHDYAGTLELTSTPTLSTTQTVNPTQTTEYAPSTTATSPLATDTTLTETPLTMTPLPTTRVPAGTIETGTASATAPTASPTPSLTPSPPVTPPHHQPTAYPSQAIMINEIAWAGTHASSSDEWIELYNSSAATTSLTGWALTDDGDININLAGDIAPHSYFLLERSDDQTISNIDADMIYHGSLRNSGETLALLDPGGEEIDSANSDGGAWPSGNSAQRFSMERRGGGDLSGNWVTFTGWGGHGLDAVGNLIGGTPRALNSIHLPSPSPTLSSSTPSATSPAEYAPLTVLINEVAWAGTGASASDEWIELMNTTEEDVDLTGWTLTDSGDVRISLSGTLRGHGYYLLERTDDNVIADVSAHMLYTGALKNSGEILVLLDSANREIDSANSDGGGWPAGEEGSRRSMERRGGGDKSGNWGTYTGYHGSGHDARGNRIQGTPGRQNSILFPTPVPTWIPGRIVINEVLIRPHYDWEGKGGVDTKDEFIELYNRGPRPVNIRGWWLDDIRDGGSKPHDLPSITIDPGGYAVFFRSWTHIALNDTGDTVRLLAPDGRLVDQISYLKVRAYNLSYGRLPDGSRHLKYGLWPTPGFQNILYVETIASVDDFHGTCRAEAGSRLLNSRFGRTPALTSWMSSLALVTCRRNTIETIVVNDLRGENVPPSQSFTVWDEHLSLGSATSQQERVR